MKKSNLKTVMKLAVMLFICAVVASVAVSPLYGHVSNFEYGMYGAGATALLFGAGAGVKHLPSLFGTGHPGGVSVAGINVEMWADRIVEPLFADSSVLSKVKRVDDEFILGGSVVHIPQAGSQGGVTKNQAVFPGVVQQRTDTDVTYPLDIYRTLPIHIPNAEQMQISYKKMDSVLSQHKGNLFTAVTRWALHDWAAIDATQVANTTGALSAANLPPSGTGQRRILTYADVVDLSTRFNEQDIPDEERYLLLDAVMYNELLKDPEVTKLSMEKLADRAKGVVAELAGFKILRRSSVVTFNNAGAKKEPGEAAAATDRRSALAWQRDCLNAAMGDVKFFETIGDAAYYGDIYSAEVKFGSRQERGDKKGVFSLVQAAS